MIKDFFKQFIDSKWTKILSAIFAILVIWWITIFARGLEEGFENDYFTLAYPILALMGGVAGLVFARKWGGFKSKLGMSIYMFSFGLLAQFFGQLLYSYYIFILGVEVPYPSLGDASYLASVVFYIFGSYELAKVSGIKLSFKSISGKLKSFGIPLLILVVSYLVLMKDYDFTSATPLLLFFDFGFPIGQAIYVSFAILALLISKDILGGMMRKPIMLLILALILQFISDFSFSYQFSQGVVYTGDILDLLYCTSYFLMAISLFSIGNMFYKVQES